MTIADMLSRLDACPVGVAGWRQFEDICCEILTFAFVPPLIGPRRQPRTYLNTDRRDALFSNRNFGENDNWGKLLQELDARMILVEFKNYDAEDIGKDEVNQTHNYLTRAIGRLALMVCNKTPEDSAYRARNNIFGENDQVILFLSKEHLKDLLYIKQRGEDPSDLIMDLVEEFYAQYE